MTGRPQVVRSSGPADAAALAALSPEERRAELASRRERITAVVAADGGDGPC